MALTPVVAGNDILVANLNQLIDCLTGVMTDQIVTLANNLVANHGIKLGTGDPGAGPDIHSQGTDIFLETNGAGTIYFRANGYGSAVNVGSYDHLGNLTVAGSAGLGNSLTVAGATTLATLACTTINTGGNTIACGGLTATTGTFSGALTASAGLTVASGQTLALSGSGGMAWDKQNWDESTLGGSHTFSRTFTTNFNGRVPAVYCTPTANGITNGTAVPAPCTITAVSATGFTAVFSSAADTFHMTYMAIG